jgi:hypothetical protein
VSLAELWLLRIADDRLDEDGRRKAAGEAERHARLIVETSSETSEQTVKTARQMRRYVEFWGDERFAEALAEFGLLQRPDWYAEGGLRDTAMKLVEILGGAPDEEPPDPDCLAEDTAGAAEDGTP